MLCRRFRHKTVFVWITEEFIFINVTYVIHQRYKKQQEMLEAFEN